MNIYLLLAFMLTSLLGLFSSSLLWFILILSSSALIYSLWKERKNQTFKPKSQNFKALEKVKQKRVKTEALKHKYIDDQITYIANMWGYNKEQEKIVFDFLEQKAYRERYNKFSASLLPQIILLIDNCNKREQKGCKREVGSRLRDLSSLMKNELKKKKLNSKDEFEITLEVYDCLLKELKQ